MTSRAVLTVVLGLAMVPVVHAQDGLRSASLPERPIASPPPGPGDLFRAKPGTYQPRHDNDHQRPQPPHAGRGSGPGHPWHGGSSQWPYTGWAYWPYSDESESTSPQAPRNEQQPEAGYLQLRLAPGDAQVFIDGAYEGTADDLRQPGSLLRAGTHRVRVDARGYQSRTFDIRITEGETVTYREALDRDVPPRPVAPAITPAEPRTMYVIPRCYAGDKPPSSDTNCDLTQLRTIR